jgi:hypothetical protein
MIPLFAIVVANLIVSCGGDDDPKIAAPKAIFDFLVNVNRSGQVSFKSESIGAASYAWDFGDIKGTSTEENPSYTYTTAGTYKVTLTVTNAGGQDSANLNVTVFIGAAELIKDGDMSKAASWSTRQIWKDADNAVDHAFKNGAFFIDVAAGSFWSNYILWQEVTLVAGKQYVFSADIASTEGIDPTTAAWIEVHFSKEDPGADVDYGPKGPTGETLRRLNFRTECGSTPFNGKIQVLAQGCVESDAKDRTKAVGADGKFTLTAAELSTGGKIFVSFKIGNNGTGNNFRSGMTLDNVSIKEVL